jgi:DNA polymerase-3 subunit alpha
MVVQLHNHSHYSILDGRSRLDELVLRAKELGQSALALTDHGVMHGAIEFYRTAKAHDVKPIVGVEAYVARASMMRKDSALDRMGSSYHLTLLAMNDVGYKNLLKLTSKAHVEGFYYRPRIDMDCLGNYSEGIFVLSGCMSGQVATHVLEDDRAAAERVAQSYRDMFGDRYAIEVHNHGHEKQERLNRGLMEIADKYDIRVVAACDSHYARPEDARSHDALLAIQTGSTLSSPTRFKVEPFGAYYLQSEAEMLRGFSGREDAVRNTEWVAERCNLNLDFSKVMLPEFPIPSGHTSESWLRKQVYEGLAWRYGNISDIHRTRADYELSIIEKTGYARYFLIVQDYVTYARREGVMAVPRGSVAGSLCVYALGICDIDPVKYDIMFERFLNAERKGMPDIDMDFADDRREDVVKYVTERYGVSKVAHIGTFQTLGARAAVKDVARVKDIDFSVSNAFTALFPDTPGITLADVENDERIRKAIALNEELFDVLELAKQIEGLTRGFGTHAAGMLITETDLDDVVPVQLPPEKSGRKSGTFVTQYDNNNTTAIIESLGLSKFDFLGLSNLSIIRDACALIRQRTGIDLYGSSGEKLYSDLPLEYKDPKARRAYDLLASGETEAVFQVESPGMRRVLRLIQPNRITDLPAIVALYRPGPMENIPVFADAKHGRRRITYLHDDLRPILEETYGVVTYQDQVLLIARKIAGFTWGEVDVLRKGMGKKQAEVIDKLKKQFVEQSVTRGYERATVEDIWEQIAPFAGYGFNRAHAFCYGYISFITAFLKANYPVEYMTTVLTHESGNKEKISQSIAECRRMFIPVLSPSVNISSANFSIASIDGRDSIVFGLSAIASIGSPACRTVIAGREKARFTDLTDFLVRTDLSILNKRSIANLVYAGALDDMGDRAQLIADIDTSLDSLRDSSRLRLSGQLELFEDQMKIGHQSARTVPPMSRMERLENEFKVIGVYISEHPLDDIREQLDYYCTHTGETMADGDGMEAIVGGMIARVKNHTQKNGKSMAFVTLNDFTGTMDVVVFSRVYEAIAPLLKEEARVLFKGKIRVDDSRASFLADDMVIINPKNSPVPSADSPKVTLMWDLSSSKVSARILKLWATHLQSALSTSDDTSVLRLKSEKGSIDVHYQLHEDVLRKLFA